MNPLLKYIRCHERMFIINVVGKETSDEEISN
jgi:hypothetical protein